MRQGNYDDAATPSAAPSPSPTTKPSPGSISPVPASRRTPGLLRAPAGGERRQRRGHRRLSARRTPAARAVALALAGGGLTKREEWKPAIRAYRASLALAETAACGPPMTSSSPSMASASCRTTSRPTARCRRSASFLRQACRLAAGPCRLRHGRGRRRARRRAAAEPDLHQRRQARQPLHHPCARRPAGGRRRDAGQPGRAQRLRARPCALGRLRRQRLCASRRPRRLDPARRSTPTRRRRRSTGSATAALPARSATAISSASLATYPPSRSPTRPASRCGRARSTSPRS